MDKRGEVWKTFIVLAPSLGAALIADSRIMDARHHPFDVLTGSLLGILAAWVAYRQYFPPVTQPWRKGRAYPIRTWGSSSEAPPDSGREPLRDGPAMAADEERADMSYAAGTSGMRNRGATSPPGNGHGGHAPYALQDSQAVEMQPQRQPYGSAQPASVPYDQQDTEYRPQPPQPSHPRQHSPPQPLPASSGAPGAQNVY